jgi:hypothetical protein
MAQAGKTLLEGQVSYVSSLNVYVKFSNTENINKGDTLYIRTDSRLLPYLVVKDKSSTSCVCSSLVSDKISVGQAFYARVPEKAAPVPTRPDPKKDKPVVTDSLSTAPPVLITPESEEKAEPAFRQNIKARLSAASYSTIYGDEATHRMRYAFTLQGKHLGNSRFSTDNYIVFRHTLGDWQEVKDNLSDALKIYSLSVNYEMGQRGQVSLGRKINPRFSSIGAIDGLQVEQGLGKFQVGAIAGSRPDFQDYGINLDLLQAGFYVGHETNRNGNTEQTTLGVMEQRNGGSTDRRFVYFQHTSSLGKHLNFFGSMELDLYENIQNEARTHASLTNMYFSLRYRFSQKFNVALSYDSRRNIIYYESYKNYIDQLIDDETRQGLRLNASYRPFKRVSLGGNANWRFQKSDINLSKNLNAYLNFSRIPLVKMDVSLTANLLKTNYLDSRMFGVRLNRELIPGKLNGEVYGRMLHYTYTVSEFVLRQRIFGADLGMNLSRKLALHLYYEGIFDKENDTLHRANTKVMWRFRFKKSVLGFLKKGF